MTVTLEPMPAAALAAWMRVERSAYIEDRMRAGDDEAAATRNANASYEKYFPGGSPAAGHDVLLVSEYGRAVGSLWLGPHPSGLEASGTSGTCRSTPPSAAAASAGRRCCSRSRTSAPAAAPPSR